MKKPIIEVKNVSKKYTIGQTKLNYSLRDTIMEKAKRPYWLFKKKRETEGKKKDFWALKNISFDVQPGESLGIIGKNGAGKSTLLKIISRITIPTEGEVIVRGKITSLLEVGTGFHIELTGRENIFLNGAILGMPQKKIKQKLKEIICFAEIDKFLDTPVKFYSSGMYMRLAFAIAAHLEPEILIMDEVLSVGDLDFQKKCMAKLKDMTQEGRTILYVSHNLSAVSQFTTKSILLEKGKMATPESSTQEVISLYVGSKPLLPPEKSWKFGDKSAPGNSNVQLIRVCIKDNNKNVKQKFNINEDIIIEIEYKVKKSGISLVPSIQIFNSQGNGVFTSNDTELEWNLRPRIKGLFSSTVVIPGNLLADGNFYVRIVISTYQPYHKHINEYEVVSFKIIDSFGQNSARGNYTGTIPGDVRPYLLWQTKELNDLSK